MTITALRPGMRAANTALTSPFTPLGHTPGGTPVYPAQGGRSSGGGIDFVVDDGDDDDPFASRNRNDDDDDDDDDDEPGEEPAARGRNGRRSARRDQDDDGDDADSAEWTPPDRESYERLTTALKRANSEAGKRRRVGKTMERLGIDDFETWLTERGIDPQTGQPYGADVVSPSEEFEDFQPGGRGDDYEREDDRPRDDERTARQRDREIAKKMLTAEQRGRRAEREALMPVLAEQAARAALRGAGFTGTEAQLERMLYSIRPGSLELEMDDGAFELVGLDEEIEALRESFPERFRDDDADERRPVRRERTGGNGRVSRGARDVDGGDRGRQPKKAPTWLEQASAQMSRRGR